MAASKVHPLISLSEDDVPGAKFAHPAVADNSVIQLRRWLECRGLPVSGNKADLVKRCEDCINAGQQNKITVTIDGGNWYEKKVHEFYQNKFKAGSSADVSPCAPPDSTTAAWKKFPSVSPPKCFNRGHIYHYIIESAKFVDTTQVDTDDEVDNSLDVGTEKPMRKGLIYFKSGHVQDMQDCIHNAFYLCKARCMASYDMKKFYNPHVSLSVESGFVRDASCNCKASALARCNHIAALLFAVLDWLENGEATVTACTSKVCEWNKGRKEKKPKALHKAEYVSVSGQPAKRKKVDLEESSTMFDPRLPSLRTPPSTDRINRLLTNLQWALGEPSMWEVVIPITYGDFALTQEELAVLTEQCRQLFSHLSCGGTGPVELIGQQGSKEWFQARAVRITASMAKSVATANKETTVSNLLRQLLWDEPAQLKTKAIVYGQKHEADARLDYFKRMRADTPGFQVEETGLWVNPLNPRLACSPDGLVTDPNYGEGLLEIKCPYVLKGHNPTDISTLEPAQRRRFCCLLESETLKLKHTHAYYFQIQMQLGVTQRKFCDFVVWSEKGLSVERIWPNPAFWDTLEKKLTEFHQCYLVPEYFLMRVPRNLLPYKLS